MPKRTPEPHHRSPAPEDPRDEVLRQALKQVREVIPSVGGILHVASKAGHSVPISRSGLDQFIDGETKSLSAANRKPLEEFLFQSRLGRALRDPESNSRIAFDHLFSTLCSGDRGATLLEMPGLYFLYHGSYIRPDYFAIRVLDIERGDDGVLSVTDYLRDNLDVSDSVLEAYGCTVTFGGLPQMIFATKDNRAGLSLIVATRSWPREHAIEGFLGRLTGVTGTGNAFQRHCLGSKEITPLAENKTGVSHEKYRAQMIAESGMYRFDQLKGRHREALANLAKLMPPDYFEDPIYAV